MKKIRFRSNVQAEVRAIEQKAAIHILKIIHLYAQAGVGQVKQLGSEFEDSFVSVSVITASSLTKPGTPSPSPGFVIGKTLTAEPL